MADSKPDGNCHNCCYAFATMANMAPHPHPHRELRLSVVKSCRDFDLHHHLANAREMMIKERKKG